MKQWLISFHFRRASSKNPAQRRRGRSSKAAVVEPGDVARARDDIMRTIADVSTGTARLEPLTYVTWVHASIHHG